ncbi:hypothetical protein OROGR_004537 [Orobanche gracilis]
MSKTSPIILLVILFLAIAFFALGLIQLLMRCLMRRSPSFSLNSASNRLTHSSNSHTFPRQLHHLFNQHDSGLDRASIDSLPNFYYKDIVGSKELFDCSVCLSEFSGADKLKLLPHCGHAFHIHCIETWLLSNSTCPLCRSLIGTSTLNGHLSSLRDPMGNFDLSSHQGANESFPQENDGRGRVFSIRLGKFKSLDGRLGGGDKKKVEGLSSSDSSSSSSNSSIDARRCYSMGAFQYIVEDRDLQVALSSNKGGGAKAKAQCTIEGCTNNNNNTKMEGMKRINSRSRGESFSISKIWLWSKKGKFPGFSDANRSFVLSMSNGSNLV